MAGALALFDIKLNYFNFIAIPITFGIGIDYAVNMFQRYRLEGKGSILDVMKTTGGAVTLCSITTIIGYFTLVIANNQALVSFGLVALIGEFTTLFAALLFLPATIILYEKWTDKRSNPLKNDAPPREAEKNPSSPTRELDTI